MAGQLLRNQLVTEATKNKSQPVLPATLQRPKSTTTHYMDVPDLDRWRPWWGKKEVAYPALFRYVKYPPRSQQRFSMSGTIDHCTSATCAEMVTLIRALQWIAEDTIDSYIDVY